MSVELLSFIIFINNDSDQSIRTSLVVNHQRVSFDREKRCLETRLSREKLRRERKDSIDEEADWGKQI